MCPPARPGHGCRLFPARTRIQTLLDSSASDRPALPRGGGIAGKVSNRRTKITKESVGVCWVSLRASEVSCIPLNTPITPGAAAEVNQPPIVIGDGTTIAARNPLANGSRRSYRLVMEVGQAKTGRIACRIKRRRAALLPNGWPSGGTSTTPPSNLNSEPNHVWIYMTKSEIIMSFLTPLRCLFSMSQRASTRHRVLCQGCRGASKRRQPCQQKETVCS